MEVELGSNLGSTQRLEIQLEATRKRKWEPFIVWPRLSSTSMEWTGTPNGASLIWTLLLDKGSGQHICKVDYIQVKDNLSCHQGRDWEVLKKSGLDKVANATVWGY